MWELSSHFWDFLDDFEEKANMSVAIKSAEWENFLLYSSYVISDTCSVDALLLAGALSVTTRQEITTP